MIVPNAIHCAKCHLLVVPNAICCAECHEIALQKF